MRISNHRRYVWKPPVRDGVQLPEITIPFDPYLLPVVPMVYRDDVIQPQNCEEEHLWVRSMVISGRREMGKKQPLYYKIEDFTIWCEACGRLWSWPKGTRPEPRETIIKRASEYYAIVNPARESFPGIDTSWYDNWVPKERNQDIHSDWEQGAFSRGGWVRG